MGQLEAQEPGARSALSLLGALPPLLTSITVPGYERCWVLGLATEASSLDRRPQGTTRPIRASGKVNGVGSA